MLKYISVFLGYHQHTQRDYSIKGGKTSQLFGIFNSFAIIALTYGNGIIPEIQVINYIITSDEYVLTS